MSYLNAIYIIFLNTYIKIRNFPHVVATELIFIVLTLVGYISFWWLSMNVRAVTSICETVAW